MTFNSASQKREQLKEKLEGLPHEERVIFCRMYGPVDTTGMPMYSEDDPIFNLDMLAKHNINEVVDKMHHSRLDWAILQVSRAVLMLNEEKE